MYSNDINKSQSKKHTRSFNAGKILIVDDEKFNCEIIDGFLMVLGIKNKDYVK